MKSNYKSRVFGMRSSATRSFAVVCLVMVWIMAGITPPNSKAAPKKKGPPAPKPQAVWPLPPDDPRIKYLTSFHGQTDFERKDTPWQRAILGPKDLEGKIYLHKPMGIAVDSMGSMYVGDTGQAAVVKITPQMGEVTLLGNKGQTPLKVPTGIAVDNQDNVYVADGNLKKVFVYDSAGNLTFSYGEPGELENPVGVAVDNARQILYVSDSHKHQILVYHVGHSTFQTAYSTRGSEKGQLNYPTFLALNKFGDIIVSDTGNFRVQVFDYKGSFKFSFGQLGKRPGDFTRPKGIAVDSMQNIYVVDSAFNNYQLFNSAGQLLMFVGQYGADEMPGNFNIPGCIAIDANDRIYVTDQLNRRVQVFQLINKK